MANTLNKVHHRILWALTRILNLDVTFLNASFHSINIENMANVITMKKPTIFSLNFVTYLLVNVMKSTDLRLDY